MPAKGLSPLARGNLYQFHSTRLQVGPIPARAGEPYGLSHFELGTGAYPRSRGGTAACVVIRSPLLGLSPLARGNRLGHGARQIAQGPIPARAGEPA